MQEVSKAIDFQLTEHTVYESANCMLTQRDGDCMYHLFVFGTSLDLKFCGFYSFYKKVKSVDFLSMFEADAPNLELIYLPHADRILAFDLEQLVELTEFFEGALAMLQLNSLIHEKTIRPLV